MNVFVKPGLNSEQRYKNTSFIHHWLFFSIYFVINQINKLHLCKPLIRAIDSSNLKNDYSPAQKVTYKYYVGRKAMFDSDFKPGNTEL